MRGLISPPTSSLTAAAPQPGLIVWDMRQDQTQKTRVGAEGVTSTAREADALCHVSKRTGEPVMEASGSGHPKGLRPISVLTGKCLMPLLYGLRWRLAFNGRPGL